MARYSNPKKNISHDWHNIAGQASVHEVNMKASIFIIMLAFSQLLLSQEVQVGASCTDEYLPLLSGKRVALMSNHTGMVGNEHTVDVLRRNGVNVTAIFSPEHGFRGTADAGAAVSDSIDKRTKVPIYSLYGKSHGYPTASQMKTFDIMVVDIQDVGVRFYTYYITLVKLMDSCAAANKPLIVLDRPNPNGHYVDGPVLDMKYKSGVGWLPIPIVHGMTLGELACMVNGECWLPEGRECALTVIKCRNYTHKTFYQLPIAPSPNLPNMKAVYLYPSTCLFEGTVMSLGRGTDFPFQVYGHPAMQSCLFSFVPHSRIGAYNPPFAGFTCYGRDLRNVPDSTLLHHGIEPGYVIDAYRNLKFGKRFFKPMFELLTGRDYVRKMIMEGRSANEIRARWKQDVTEFKAKRKKYLLYEE